VIGTVLYNLLMLGVDAALLRLLAAKRSTRAALLILTLAGLPALILAGLLSGNLFGVMRLLAYGVFLHGFLLLGGAAALLRRSSWKGALLSANLALLLAAVAMDAFLVEPTWLEISSVRIRSPKLKRPIRIVVLADFQTDRIGTYERLVIARTIETKPDLILMAGDHLQEEGPALEDLRDEFRRMLYDLGGSAPLGIYAVRGNMDPDDWTRIFERLPITAIDATRSIDLPDLRLTALGVNDSFNPSLSVAPSERFHVVLGHSPDYALGNIGADLLIAGHTHGGQVRIPGIGPLITLSHVPRSWAAGVTTLEGGRTLVVSRGIGMERGSAPRLRFLCRPELVVIDLFP